METEYLLSSSLKVFVGFLPCVAIEVRSEDDKDIFIKNQCVIKISYKNKKEKNCLSDRYPKQVDESVIDKFYYVRVFMV